MAKRNYARGSLRLPPSEIGEVAVFARRRGDTWFLAILNGPDVRQVPLSFLEAGDYRVLLVHDRKNDPAAVEIENGMARRSDLMAMELSAGGGFIARFTRP